MGIRIGRKIGKYFVSTGKSGTRVSTKVGDYYVSSFTPRRSKKKETVEEIGCVATEEENSATTKMVWMNLGLTLLLFAMVWVTGEFFIPLGIVFLFQAIGAHFIWKSVDTDCKWFNWFFPVVALFVTPLAWVWWIAIFIISYMVI